MDAGIVSLALVDKGKRGTIVALQGGGNLQERIVSMGLFLGCEVEVLDGGNGRRMLIAARDTRIALGHGIAEKVLVAVDPGYSNRD